MIEVRNSRILKTLTFMITICLFSFPVQAKYGGGTGEPNDPYLISTTEHLISIGSDPNLVDKYFMLVNDIDLDPNLPDGRIFIRAVIAPDIDFADGFQGTTFTGGFDGKGHKIRNLTIRDIADDYIGLFGQVGTGGRIQNLGLEGITANGSVYVGSLAGLSCGTIKNCYATGSVFGFKSVGGLVGANYCSIYTCYAACNVTGHHNSLHIGGLVGWNDQWLHTSYATGNVYAGRYSYGIGGLVGINGCQIADCYSAGSVSAEEGSENIGGLVGNNTRSGYFTNCFWDVQTSGPITSAIGDIGKTTVEMQDPNTFMAAGWDFIDESDGPGDIWAIPVNGGYPVLWWQLSESEQPELPAFSGGTGEPNDPFLIATVEQLNSIGHNPRLMDSHFKLVNDIDLADVRFYPIGNEVYPFRGVFDGDGFEISNFTYTSIKTRYAGLFRYINGRNAEVRNLGLINPDIDSVTDWKMGSLVGGMEDGTLISCYVKGGSVAGRGYNGEYNGNIYIADSIAGGLVGTSGGKIINCHVDCIVFGSRSAGGLVGASGGLIINSTSSGNVSTDHCAGGLTASNSYRWTTPAVTNCYSTASVVGRREVGGLVGDNGSGIISNCYSTGSVVGGEMVGGLVGNNDDGLVEGSFWDIETSWQTTSDGGTGLTTAEMQMQSTFLDAGWDFVDETANGNEDIWWILEGEDYPCLWWELIEDDLP
jgi:hypothetical protein